MPVVALWKLAALVVALLLLVGLAVWLAKRAVDRFQATPARAATMRVVAAEQPLVRIDLPDGNAVVIAYASTDTGHICTEFFTIDSTTRVSEYNGDGYLVSVTDRTGGVTSYTYAEGPQ